MILPSAAGRPDAPPVSPASTGPTGPTVSPNEAAALLSLSPETVRRHWREGTLAGRKVRGRVVLNRAAVERLLPHDAPIPPAVERAVALVDELAAGELARVAARCVERLAHQAGDRAGGHLTEGPLPRLRARASA